MSIYYHSATYAREHGELDKYRSTSEALRTCAMNIENIISARFDGMRLPGQTVDEALAIHSPELIGLVLSSTILYKEWDGRFSRSNKDWAHTVRQPDRADSLAGPVTVNTHPAILDGFVTMFRKVTA